MSVAEYWEHRYKTGGTSGPQSHREWEWEIISKYFEDGCTILDVGCGDMQFWKGVYLSNYTGIDISETAVRHARSIGYNAICLDALTADFPRYDVVLCLNTLYHLMTDDDLCTMLRNLNRWTRKYLIVTNWCKEPEHYNQRYQRFSPLRDHLECLSGLQIVEGVCWPQRPFLKLYVFERRKRSYEE